MGKLSLWYTGVFIPATTLLPIYFAAKSYRYLDNALKIIFVYLLIAGITNVIGAVFAAHGINNLFLLHFYTAVEFSFISFYFSFLFKKPSIKRFVRFTIIVYVLYCLLNALFLQHIKQFNTYTRSIQAIILVSYGLYYLYLGIGNLVDSNKKNAHYWITIGLIVYFTSSLIQFSFSNVFSAYFDKEVRIWLWNFHATMVLVMYLFFTKAYVIYKE